MTPPGRLDWWIMLSDKLFPDAVPLSPEERRRFEAAYLAGATPVTLDSLADPPKSLKEDT